METKKVTLAELKVMENFTAVNKKGVKADFVVNGDSAVATFENGGQKEMKLDSIRRSWQVVVEPEVTEVEAEVVEVEEEQMELEVEADVEAVDHDRNYDESLLALAVTEEDEEAEQVSILEDYGWADEADREVSLSTKTLESVDVRLFEHQSFIGRKHMKYITIIQLGEEVLLEIKQNGKYISEVKVRNKENYRLVYESKKFSVNDALEFLGLDKDERRKFKTAISRTRKAAIEGLYE